MSVVVITSTIGRPELRQCIESVRAQVYPCRHYVFVNGPQWHYRSRKILQDFPHVHAIYLPEETGNYGVGCSMADVFAAAPFLTQADWIMFLDDDNWFEPTHVNSLFRFARANDLQWAYSLRRFVDKDGKYICDDNWSSLGHWPIYETKEHLVDNSCYFVSRKLACKMSLAWTALPVVADRCFFMALQKSGAKYGTTGLYTANYRIGLGTGHKTPKYHLGLDMSMQAEVPDGFPWAKAQVFNHPIQPVD